MKKLIAVFLSTLMLVCAVIPALASDAAQTPQVSNITGKTVTIDGKKGEDEGWSEKADILLDTPKDNTTSTCEPASEVYVSTDGEYLYAFFKSAKENWTNESKNTQNQAQLYFYLLFPDDANGVLDLRFNFNSAAAKDANIGTALYNSVEAEKRTTDYLPYVFRYTTKVNDAYVFPDLTLDFKMDIGEDVATLEFKIELPDATTEALKKGDAELKVGLFEKELKWGKNWGKINTGMNVGEGGTFTFNAVIPVTLPEISYEPDTDKPDDNDGNDTAQNTDTPKNDDNDGEEDTSAIDTAQNTETQKPAADTAKQDEGGCGSTVGASAFVLIACVGISVALPFRKREE